MIRDLSEHRSNDRDVIDVLRRLFEQLANFDSALAIRLKSKWRRKCSASFALGRQIVWDTLACVTKQGWLGVKSIHMRWTTVEKKVDDAFCFAWKMRLSGAKRVIQLRGIPAVQRDPVLEAHRSQANGAQSHSGPLQHLAAAGESPVFGAAHNSFLRSHDFESF